MENLHVMSKLKIIVLISAPGDMVKSTCSRNFRQTPYRPFKPVEVRHLSYEQAQAIDSE